MNIVFLNKYIGNNWLQIGITYLYFIFPQKNYLQIRNEHKKKKKLEKHSLM